MKMINDKKVKKNGRKLGWLPHVSSLHIKLRSNDHSNQNNDIQPLLSDIQRWEFEGE